MKLLIPLLALSIVATSPIVIRDTNMVHRQETVQTQKFVLLSFSGSDWCVPCIRMKEQIFNSEVFISYATAQLTLINADFPRLKKNQLSAEQVKKNEELADKYNKEGKFPFTLLLDANGKVLKQWDGLPPESAEAFVEELKSILNAGS